MASELEAAAVRLRRAGQDDLARELAAGMRRGVAPVPDLIRAGLVPHLPNRYAATLDADLDIKTITRSGSATTDAVVSVYATTRGQGPEAEAAGRRADPPPPVRGPGALVHAGGPGSRHGARLVHRPGGGRRACRVRAELERALSDVAAKAGG